MQKTGGSTLTDVAKRAGVSKSAVASVISGYRVGTRVSDTTRARIQEAARDLGYQPNAIARSLSKKRTNIIGLYYGHGQIETSGLFGAEVVFGLQQGCNDHRKDLLVHGTFPGRTTEQIYTELASGMIDGLIVMTTPEHSLVRKLEQSAFPVVAIVDAIPSLPSLVIDESAGSRMVAEHLWSKGHRRVLYRRHFDDSSSRDRRLAGFLEAAEELGMHVTVCRPRGLTEELSDEELALLSLPDGERPTAVACWSDWFTHIVLRYARSRNWRVPEDLAVAGFDGFYPHYEPVHRLTSVVASWYVLGRTATGLIARMLNGEEVPQETVLPVKLHVGETS